MNTSDPFLDQPDDQDPDLATRFAAATRPASMSAVESDLDAVHRRSRQVQRRRVIGGSAAAGLLVVGGGLLVVTDRGDEPTTAVQASAGVDGIDATETSLVPDDDAPTNPTEPTGTPFDLSELDGTFDDFPIPELPPFPQPQTDGSTDWSSYVEQLGRSLEAWVADLQIWLSDNPDVTTWFDLDGPFGEIAGPNGELDIDGWLDGLDLDTWRDQLESGEFDIDEWLADLGVPGEDAGPFPFPDLDDLDLGEFGPLDGLDLEQFDLDQLFQDITGGDGQLPDLSELESQFEDLLGQLGTD